LVVGIGALTAWPLISPIARPVAKSVLKGGLNSKKRCFAGVMHKAATSTARNLGFESTPIDAIHLPCGFT
jgi:hypothetical protein